MDLVVSGVLGLVWVRLGDDLADGAIRDEDRAQVIAAREQAYAAALGVFRERLAPGSAFWSDLRSVVARWDAETRRGGDDPAALGAPLRIPAGAALWLAGRPDLLPALQACLDRLVLALVLLDHANDWEVDLRQRRPNRFVASVVSGALAPRAVEVRARMLAEPEQVAGYFERIAEEAEVAARGARTIPLAPLERRARMLAAEARRQGEAWARRRQEGLTAAATMLGGTEAGRAVRAEERGWRMDDQERSGNDYEQGPAEEPMATPEQRERLAGRALVDDTFRAWLRSDPKSAAAFLGVSLTERELQRLQGVDWESFDELARQVQNAAGFQAGAGWG